VFDRVEQVPVGIDPVTGELQEGSAGGPAAGAEAAGEARKGAEEAA